MTSPVDVMACFSSQYTVLSVAEELGIQRCSLAPFLIFLIPADLRSYLRSKQLASMQYKVQGLRTYRIQLSKTVLIGTRQYCHKNHIIHFRCKRRDKAAINFKETRK